ncbi:hypothetical protein Cgig2_010431 [Carnegiea gigantea]|uniref:Uncharacterized protein n=1 Tax=Carnegiea gigantea TaxID=171969 RepID=A0A9Q1GLI5_9CARY|nr:hypothetical protein Cgig2_010431 [Carnegiea gigantea]
MEYQTPFLGFDAVATAATTAVLDRLKSSLGKVPTRLTRHKGGGAWSHALPGMVFSGFVPSRLSRSAMMRGFERKKIMKRPLSVALDDDTAFGWGLSLGIMYMMSAGKAEVNKLSKTIDDTAKVRHELKFELNKQKSSHSQQPLGKTGDTKDTMDSMQKAIVE